MPLRRMGRPGLLGLAARTAVVAGTAQAVAGGMANNQQRKNQRQYEQEQYAVAREQAEATMNYQGPATAPVPQQAPPPAAPDLMAQLQRLVDLKASGLLTDEEFTAAKSKLLS